jgi:hypothetical protein
VLRKIQVLNQTRNTILAREAGVADTSRTRRKGLLKHESLADGEGLWIVPCEAVHTFGMKFPIDVLYLDRKRRVLKVRERVVPWRMSACLRAHSVLELPAGTASRAGTRAGDQLEFINS